MENKTIMFVSVISAIAVWVVVIGVAIKTVVEPEPKKAVVIPELGIATSIDSQMVRYTVYNAEEGQTDASPLITADQSNIDVKELAIGNLRWIAVSRDLLKIYKFGDTIIVTGCTQDVYNGEWVIHDVMNKRFTKKIDFLVPSKIKFGRGFAFIKKK
jgi:3D (Asp-Asp-Asp) domain-containing protein